MRLYKIHSVGTPEVAPVTHWAGSQTECAVSRKAMLSEDHPKLCITIKTVEVPTSKSELIAWLNQYEEVKK